MPRKKFNTAETFEGMKSDYAAAKSSRFRRQRTGLAAGGSGADYHYRSEAAFLRMIENARAFCRDDVISNPLLDRAVDNTVQTGFTPDPSTGDEGADAALKDRWADWSTDPDQCDATQEMTFYDMERLSFRSTLRDGDILANPHVDGFLQLVEAHRCRTPSNTKLNVVHGIKLNELRRRIEYWITNDDIDPMQSLTKVGDITAFPARDSEGHRNFFHIYRPDSVSQTRGVTAFHPIFDEAGMFEDIQFAKLVQQQAVSCITYIEEQLAGGDYVAPPTQSAVTGEVTTETRDDGSSQRVEGLSPGLRLRAPEGMTIKPFSPNVPNAEYFEHVKMILTMLSINLGVPLVLLLMDGSETNFSGWRGAFDEAKKGFRRNQKALSSRLHVPTYRWKVRQWLEEDAALRTAAGKSGVNIFHHTWNMPTWPYIEPLKDASADLLRVKNMLTSPRRMHAERGQDWDDIVVETVADNKAAIIAAIRAANEINQQEKPDQPITWRELLQLPGLEDVNIAALMAGDQADQPKQQGNRAA